VHNVPLLTATFLILALAGVGLPGTNGFNGEHLVILGTFQQHWYMALAAGVGTFLTAAYFLWYFQRAFMGSLNPSIHKMPDLRPREMFIVAVLGAMIFWIGLDTGPLLRRMNGSLQALAIRVEQGSYVEPQRAAAVNQARGESRDSSPATAGSE
jgi:NADH-quinone oxidoreductase subunit M